MTPINYINDFGANVVKCLWYIQKTQNSKLKTQKSGESKQRWLGEMYAEASNYIKEHEEEVRGELDEFQKKLEARDSKVSKLFNQTRTWSLEGLYKIHKELGAMHDVTFFEKDMKDKGQKKVDQLLKKGIAQVGERDAIIIDLKEYGLDIALLRKSTGAGLYLTSDLALAEEKFKKYKVDENINITGAEQIFYFKQLFKVLELNGFKNKMTHIGYGLVNLPSGKMSSRTGSVILYEDLRDEIYGRMLNETQSRHADWKETKVKKTAMALTMAILKFDMQKHEAAKNITFDINEAASFEGFSAPYVLYVVARINSLMKKGNEGRGTRDEGKKKAADLNLIREQEEKKILMLIAEYPEAIRKALENYNPSVITKYSFDVAQAFNNFYNKHSILNADSKKLVRARLALCGAVHSVLTDALKLLTIETVSEM
jgi:arginyl-tRNA synthetase